MHSWKIAVLALTLLSAAVAAPYEGASFTREFTIPPAEELGPDVTIQAPGVPLGPPDNPQVGDSWVWWLWTWYPMPPHFEQHVCTVRGVGEKGYVVVKDAEWQVSIDQADVDSILEHWDSSSIGPYPDQGIYEIDSLSFGTPPDELDDDPRIYLMWYDFEVAADGFFFYFDQYPEGTFPGYHSNECEVLYLNTMSTGGPSGDYMHGVIAHEFQHMIHWKYDENEASWVDEGMAELAMYFFGHPDNISSFNSSPDNDLTVWDGEWADYIQTYLWSLYFFERYGGHEAVYALVHEPANSMAGYDAVLDSFGYPDDTEDVFADWVVANFLDDTTIEDGRYGYALEDLPSFNTSGSYSSYPVEAEKSVSHWAADYYRFQDFPFQDLEIAFDGADDNTFAVRIMALRNSQPPEVLEMTVEGAGQSGTVTVEDLTDPGDQVILAVASVSFNGSPQYSFTAGDAMGVSGEEGSVLSIRPMESPARGTVSFALGWPGGETPVVKLFDLQGRVAGTAAVSASGTAQWDSREAAPGVYFARAVHESGVSTARMVLLK